MSQNMAVIVGLKMATTLGAPKLEVRSDLLLIVSQANEKYTVKNDRMVAYLKVVTGWKAKFSHCNFKQVPRSKNQPHSLQSSTSNSDAR